MKNRTKKCDSSIEPLALIAPTTAMVDTPSAFTLRKRTYSFTKSVFIFLPSYITCGRKTVLYKIALETTRPLTRYNKGI